MKKGFTLIELLVVVAIISLLSSVIFSSLNTARARARFAERNSDMVQIRTALELFYTTNGYYPAVTVGVDTGWRSQCSGWGSFASQDVIPNLVPQYMKSFPSDPQMDVVNSTSCYLYRSNGKGYKFLIHQGAEVNANIPQVFYDSYRPTWAWQLCAGTVECTW